MKRISTFTLVCLIALSALLVFSSCLRSTEQPVQDNSQQNNQYNDYKQYNEYNNQYNEPSTSGTGSSDPAHTHSFDDWTRVKAPGCSEDGIEERWCNCGEKQSRTIASTGHTPGDWIVDRAATCSSTGIRHRECTTCFETVKTEELPASGHVEGSLVTTKEATCTSNGEKQAKCTICNEVVKTEVIPSIGGGHSEGSFVTTVEATCTTDGLKQSTCRNCGAVIRSEAIPAKGHSEGSMVTLKKADCSSPGVKQSQCRVCNEVIRTEEIPASEHKFKTSTIAPTCEEYGQTKYACKNCDYFYLENDGKEPLGHRLGVNGICLDCEKDFSVNMRSRVGAPLEDAPYGFSYYAGGTYLNLGFEAINTSGKTIKKCTIEITAYNNYGELLRYSEEKTVNVSPNGRIVFNMVKYNDYFGLWGGSWARDNTLTITNIKLEYSDGTIECGPYGYSTTIFNKALH